MSIKFKSQATGDLVMVQAHAMALLSRIGKPDDKGIIEVADMPSVLGVLKSLPDGPGQPPNPADQGQDDDQVDDTAPPAFADEFVSLHKRAWPLIKMIEEAQAAGKPIVWGV